MKKVRQSWEKRYWAVRLFREDVEEILNIVTTTFEQADAKEDWEDWENKVRIQVGGFELDNTDELAQIPEDTVGRFYIGVGGGRFRLSLSEESAVLEINDREDVVLFGVANRVNEILKKRRRLSGFLLTPYWLGLVLFGFPLLYVVGLGFLFKLSKTADILLGGVLAVAWIGAQWYYYYGIKHLSTIHMYHSYEKPSFFKRKKDAILVAVIASVITFILTIIGTLVVQWITKKPNP